MSTDALKRLGYSKEIDDEACSLIVLLGYEPLHFMDALFETDSIPVMERLLQLLPEQVDCDTEMKALGIRLTAGRLAKLYEEIQT